MSFSCFPWNMATYVAVGQAQPEKDTFTHLLGAQEAGGIFWSMPWKSSFQWNEWAAMFEIFTTSVCTETQFGYCLTCLLFHVLVEGQTYDAPVWLLLFNLKVNFDMKSRSNIYLSEANKHWWNRLCEFFSQN